MSGADFDGDTVMCIPTHDASGKVRITSTDPLKGLEGFDPKTTYGADNVVKGSDGENHYYRNGQEYRLMTKKGTQIQMGVISNLITDMTLDGGASTEELAAAVRHSMVVIDAEKHHLDYRQSEIDNNIAALHKKYQGKATGGASTILSRSKSPEYVDKRQGSPKTNLEDKKWYDPTKPIGSKIYTPADDLYEPDKTYDKKTKEVTIRTTSGDKIVYKVDDKEAAKLYAPIKKVNKDTGEVTYTNRDGDITYNLKKQRQKSTKMAETDDAYTLVSNARNPKELAYADYANSMKALANQARIDVANTGKIAYSKNAADTYRTEVTSLMDKLRDAELNRTRERAAQRMANYEVNSKLKSGQIDKDDVKKTSQRALTKYRQEVGSISRKKRNIPITDREWAAIQAGAISESKLKRILNNADVDSLRARAMPKQTNTLSAAKVNKIKSMSASNYSIGDIAEALGVSKSTVSKYLKGVN